MSLTAQAAAITTLRPITRKAENVSHGMLNGPTFHLPFYRS